MKKVIIIHCKNWGFKITPKSVKIKTKGVRITPLGVEITPQI